MSRRGEGRGSAPRATAAAPGPAPLPRRPLPDGPVSPVRASLTPSLCPRRTPFACSLVCSEPQRSARDESLQWHEFNSTLFILQPLYLTSTPDSTLQGGARGEAEGEGRGGGGGGGRGAGGGGRSATLPAPAPGRADASRTPSARKEGGGGCGSGPLARFGGAEAPGPSPHSPPPAPRPWSAPLAHVAKDGHLR